jgi:anti-repressor protein
MTERQELVVFNHAQFGAVRVHLDAKGDPWWAVVDVCRVLDITNNRDAIASLDDDEKITVANTDGNPRAGIPHHLNFVSEPGLYSLILRSRKPEAKEFKRWVTHEVLPAIRKTGAYTPELSDSDLIAKALVVAQKTLAESEERRRRMTEKILTDAPKVTYAETVMASGTDVEVGELVSMLLRKGFEIGKKRLFTELRDQGWLIKQPGPRWNMPTQKASERGFIVETLKLIKDRNGQPVMTHFGNQIAKKVPMITPEGQSYFLDYFLSNQQRTLFELVPRNWDSVKGNDRN